MKAAILCLSVLLVIEFSVFSEGCMTSLLCRNSGCCVKRPLRLTGICSSGQMDQRCGGVKNCGCNDGLECRNDRCVPVTTTTPETSTPPSTTLETTTDEVTTTEATTPKTTTSEVTTLEVTTPVDTSPEATTPEVTTIAATTAEVTDAQSTESVQTLS